MNPAAAVRRLAALLLPVAALAACGEPAPPPPTTTLDLRLAPWPDASGDQALFEPGFATPESLAPWYVLDVSPEKLPVLTPAAEHERISWADGVVRVAPGDSVLVRLVELPPDVMWEARLHLTAPPDVTGGEASDALRFPPLDELDDDEASPSLAGLHARGAEEGEARRLFNRWAAQILNFRPGATGGFAWDGLPGPEDRRDLVARFRSGPTRELRALCLWFPDRAVELTSVSVGPVPVLGRSDLDAYAHALPSRDDDLYPALVSFAGELRPALAVEADSGVTFRTTLPPGARALDFGVALSPHHGPGARVNWSVELVGGEGAFDTAGEGGGPPPPDRLRRVTETHGGVEQVVDYLSLGHGSLDRTEAPVLWEDVSLAWPAGARRGGEAVLHLAVSGHGPLYVAQPHVAVPAPADHPNLLLISIDTLRPDHMGLHGYERPTTPRLDAFARDAVVFDDVMSTGPYTLPSHATMLTGLYPFRHGARDTTDRLDTDRAPTLPKLLAGLGYATAAFTGGGFLSPDYGFSGGFDRYQSVDPVHAPDNPFARFRYSFENRAHRERLDERHSVDELGRWIADQGDGRWFAFLHTYFVHEYIPSPAVFARFDTSPGSDWGFEVGPRLRPRAWVEEPPGPADVAHLVNLYDASLAQVDEEIGGLLQALEAAGVLEDTLVVITSDHGEEFHEHGHLRHSQSLYEEMLKVPLIVRPPGGVEGGRVSQAFHQVDLAPTVLELMDLPVPPGLDGRSRVAWMPGVEAGEGRGDADRRTARTPPPDLYANVETSLSRRATLEFGGYKLIRGDTSDALVYPAAAEWELYDLSNDPGETTNLFEAEADTFARLRERLQAVEARMAAQAVESRRADVQDAVLEQLRELGYVAEDH